MADIELVIKIPEDEYRWIKQSDKNVFADVASKECMLHAIKNGAPLPKGHGDLIDVNRKITVPIYDDQYEEYSEKTMTVREALNRWSDEGVTVKDVIILADKEGEEV